MEVVEIARHAHVDTRQERLFRGISAVGSIAVRDQFLIRGPVGHDQALERPFAAQQIGQQPVIAGGGHAVDIVECRHGGDRTGREAAFEWREMNLAQRLHRDVDAVVIHARANRTISGEMLRAGEHASRIAQILALEPAHASSRHRLAEAGILARAFGDATPALVTRDIDHWCEGPVNAKRCGFERRAARGELRQIGVERSGLGQRDREDRAQPMDDIGAEDQRNTQPGFLQRHALHRATAGDTGAVEQHADTPSADVGELCRRIARRRTGIEHDAGRAKQVAETAELTGLFGEGHACDQAFDAVRLRQRDAWREGEAGDHCTGLEKRTAGKLHEGDILGAGVLFNGRNIAGE